MSRRVRTAKSATAPLLLTGCLRNAMPRSIRHRREQSGKHEGREKERGGDDGFSALIPPGENRTEAQAGRKPLPRASLFFPLSVLRLGELGGRFNGVGGGLRQGGEAGKPLRRLRRFAFRYNRLKPGADEPKSRPQETEPRPRIPRSRFLTRQSNTDASRSADRCAPPPPPARTSPSRRVHFARAP